jgi:hypothetical protein
MQYTLVVVHAFGGHKRGDIVLDPRAIETILSSENAAHVVKVRRALKEG